MKADGWGVGVQWFLVVEQWSNILLRSYSSWDWNCVLNAVEYFLHADLDTAWLTYRVRSTSTRSFSLTWCGSSSLVTDKPEEQQIFPTVWWCCTASSAPQNRTHCPACACRVGIGGVEGFEGSVDSVSSAGAGGRQWAAMLPLCCPAVGDCLPCSELLLCTLQTACLGLSGLHLSEFSLLCQSYLIPTFSWLGHSS